MNEACFFPEEEFFFKWKIIPREIGIKIENPRKKYSQER
jgi:hypothetical protein